jgi:hypothetical protein
MDARHFRVRDFKERIQSFFLNNLHISKCAQSVALQISWLFSISSGRLQPFLQVIQCYRHWWKVNLTFHKNQKEKWREFRSGEGGDRELDLDCRTVPQEMPIHEGFHSFFGHKLVPYRTEHNIFSVFL